MSLNVNSLAAVVGATAKNVQFVPEAANLPRKLLLIGTYDPLLVTVDDNVPVRILSAADAGARFGQGFMLHRLAVKAFLGSNGIETWAIPQPEGVFTAAAGSVDFTGSTQIGSGSVSFYVAGLPVRAFILSGDDADTVAVKLKDAINAELDLPVTAAIDLSVTAKVNITSKTAGDWGNHISLRFNLRPGDVLPDGIIVSVVDMAAGAGIPDIDDALDSLGTDDDRNERFFTDMVHGYGQDTDTLDKVSLYVGEGNEFSGLYDKVIGRPFRSLYGDVASGTAGLTALIAFTDDRKLDRSGGPVSVPGSASHPAEIAARAIGSMAAINNDRAAQSYIGIAMGDIDPGELADRWTSDYDNRDLAVRSGVSPTRVIGGVVLLQNVVTTYRPDSVSVTSNGFRSQRNISIIQNMLWSLKNNFERAEWQGISIVQSVEAVTSATDRQKVRDINSVRNDLVALAKLFESKAWLYTAEFTIDGLRKPGAIVIRGGATGFDGTIPVLLSGEGGILDMVVEFDVSITAAAA